MPHDGAAITKLEVPIKNLGLAVNARRIARPCCARDPPPSRTAHRLTASCQDTESDGSSDPAILLSVQPRFRRDADLPVVQGGRTRWPHEEQRDRTCGRIECGAVHSQPTVQSVANFAPCQRGLQIALAYVTDASLGRGRSSRMPPSCKAGSMSQKLCGMAIKGFRLRRRTIQGMICYNSLRGCWIVLVLKACLRG